MFQNWLLLNVVLFTILQFNSIVTLWIEIFSILSLILIEFSLGFEMRCHLFHSSNQNMVKIIKVLERSPERYTERAVFDGCNCIKLFKARKC